MTVEAHGIYQAAVWLWKIVSPILILFGTIGNILVVVVLTRKKFKKTTMSVFLVCLAISDILVLNTGLLRQWITYAFGVDIRKDLTEGGCRIHWFVVYVTTQFSSWMLICVTSERTINTCLPYQRSFMCTFKKAYIAVGTILAVLVFLNGHYLFGYGTLTSHNGNFTSTQKCVPLTPSYDKFIIYDWTWIDLCVFYLIPMLVLIIGNSIIAYKVIQSHRKTRSVAPMPGSSVATIQPNSLSGEQQQQQFQQQQKSTTMSTSTNSTNVTKTSKISSLTVTLMLVSVVFITCITPIVVYPIGDPYWKEGASESKMAELFFWESLSNIIMYVNNSINCILYFFSGSKFRQELKRVFCPSKYTGTVTGVPSNTMAATSAAR